MSRALLDAVGVVTVGTLYTVMETVLDEAVPPALSVTVTLTLVYVPGVVGVHRNVVEVGMEQLAGMPFNVK